MKIKFIILTFLALIFISFPKAALVGDEQDFRYYYKEVNEGYINGEFLEFNIDFDFEVGSDMLLYSQIFCLLNTDDERPIMILSGTKNGVYFENRYYKKDFENGNLDNVYQDEFVYMYRLDTNIKIATKGKVYESLKFQFYNDLVTLYPHSKLYTVLLNNPHNLELSCFGHINISDIKKYDVTPPIIETSDNIYTDIGNALKLEDMIKGIKITDEFCGDLTGRAVVKDTNYNPLKVGDYFVTITATDDFENTVEKTIYIHVVDFNPPLIEGVLEYTVGVKKYITIDEVINNLTITDNSNQEVSLNIVDNYTPNKNQVGTHLILVEAIDKTFNSSNVTITINVIDDLEPTIESSDTYAYMSNTYIIDDFKKFSYSDNVTANESLIVEYETNFDELKSGDYYIKCIVTDEALNKSVKTAYIHYIDDVAPEFELSNKIVDYELSLEELYNYFKN